MFSCFQKIIQLLKVSRHFPKNKNSIIDQSQRALYDTYFLNSNIGMRNVATLGKSVEKYEPDCLVVYSFSNIFYSYASYCNFKLKFRKETELVKYELFKMKCRYGFQVY